jgi:hypothetical protein
MGEQVSQEAPDRDRGPFVLRQAVNGGAMPSDVVQLSADLRPFSTNSACACSKRMPNQEAFGLRHDLVSKTHGRPSEGGSWPVTTLLSLEYEAMLGERVGKDWGINEPGMKQTTQI